MKVGLVITAFNRPFELRRCLDSLKQCDLPAQLFITIIDDASTNLDTIDLIREFEIAGVKILKIYNRFNYGIKKSLLLGFHACFRNACEVVFNLDGDAIVQKQFFSRLLQLHGRHPRHIVTGFNSSNLARHPIISKHGDFVKKKKAGGINFVFNREIFNKFITPALTKNNVNWDTFACDMAYQQGLPVIAATPSVVQHIAESSTLGHNHKPDMAEDFEYEEHHDNVKIERIMPMQFFGLGDIIFCISIARNHWLPVAEVVWPAMPHFVEGLSRAYPDIKFVDYTKVLDVNWERKETRVTLDGTKIIPLRWSYEITGQAFCDCMKSKYTMFDLDWRTWKDKAMWTRDKEKEIELLRLVNPTGKPFNLINRFFKSSSEKEIKIKQPDNRYNNIEMQTMEGYSLFDWAAVMEQAVEIHTVSTSIIYLLELLHLRAHIYIRRPDERSHSYYDYLLEQKHILHP